MSPNKPIRPFNLIPLWIAAGFLFLALLFFLFRNFRRTGLDEKISSGKPIHILFHAVGNDDVYEFGFLATIFPSQERVGLFFFHPITTFEDPEDSLEQIKSKATSAVKDAVQDILGSKPNYTVKINASSFIKIVDILGGVNLYTDNRTNRVSPSYVREPGLYSYSGEDAYDYVSYMDKKETLDYLDRISRQESAVLSVYETLYENKELLNSFWSEMVFSLIDSDFSKEDFYTLLKFATSHRLAFGITELPGEPALDPKTRRLFLTADPARASVAIRKFHKDVSAEIFTDGEYARTEVLNGTEVAGLAKDVRTTLADKRIKVLSVDNAWTKDIEKTVILDRSGNTAVADKISSILEKTKVYHVLRKDLGLDSTVLLGSDIEPKK
ncbi:LytR family transcriptional regulator [Leptospira selangorensis]|uniref:LytR family transcriptional regulator n=1 Tax=Leptospira selangorensis TaxID=2484982 RepID=A0A5F2BXA5_9LEPT|nr:LCP family protein [Leptospira selangorensis]TGM12249.1 LytR family transcriptional regulator [Leptospira selangorensis]TGM14708.1 LytR family transcriptional regulator [Leptospira selangorensis]